MIENLDIDSMLRSIDISRFQIKIVRGKASMDHVGRGIDVMTICNTHTQPRLGQLTLW